MKALLTTALLLTLTTTPSPQTFTSNFEHADHKKEAEKAFTQIAQSDPAMFAAPSVPAEPISIAFTGDTMMDWSVKTAIASKGSDYPFVHVKPSIEAADFAMLNLETAITDAGSQQTKQYTFRSNPDSLSGIKNAGFDLISLANNHSMDFGQNGLSDTFHHLTSYGIPYVGAGENKAAAYSSYRTTIKGKTLSFFGFSRVLPEASWFAGETKAGIASAYEIAPLLSLIQEEKKQADYVFVFIHWGEEKKNQPTDYQKSYAKQFIDVGADGVIGHHPHVLQGFEFYKNKPIAYSLGNFLFPDYVTGPSAETGILTLFLENDHIKMQFEPYRIGKNQIVPITDSEKEAALQYLSTLSVNTRRNNGFFVPANP